MINNFPFLNTFNFDNISYFLNTPFVSSIIGSVITILGVFLTIRDDRISRKQERKDEIKPTLSIQFLGIEDSVKNLDIKNYKSFLNRNTFAFFPIFQYISLSKSARRAYFIHGYNRTTNLLFKIHTDGKFPVRNIFVSKIKVTDKKDKNFIHSKNPRSIGESFPRVSSAFDLFYDNVINNFDIIDGFDEQVVVDTNDLNAYISPGTDIVLKIPLRIGCIKLTNLIKFIRTNKLLKMLEYKKGVNYSLDDEDNLCGFLSNFASFPIQTSINFKYFDIDDNCYNKSFQCYAGLKIKPTSQSDFILTGDLTTNDVRITEEYNKTYDDLEKVISSCFSKYRI